MGGPRAVDAYQTTHPGIPFQIAGWIAYRLAYLDAPSGFDGRLTALIADPARFGWAVRIAALVTLLLGTLGLAWLLRVRRALPLLAGVALFISYPAFWYRGFEILTIESLAFPLAAAAAYCALVLFRNAERPLYAAAVVGAFFAIAYLNKLNYLAWPAGFGVAIIADGWLRQRAARRVAAECGCFALGFGLCVLFVGVVFLGPAGLRSMATTHLLVFLNTGMYGAGAPGVVDAGSASRALASLMRWPNAVAFLALLAVAVLAPLRLYRIGRRDDDGMQFVSTAIFLSVATLLGIAVAVKHFDEHYLLPSLALGSCLLVIWLSREASRPAAAVAVAAIALSLLAQAAYLPSHLRNEVAFGRLTDELTAAVLALPLSPGEVRLWGYHSRYPGSILLKVAQEATVPAVTARLTAAFPQDRYSYTWTLGQDEDPNWRYAVLAHGMPGTDSFAAKAEALRQMVPFVVFRNKSPRSPGARTP